MRVLISADAEGVTGVTNTTELLFGKPHWEWMRGMMTNQRTAPAGHRTLDSEVINVAALSGPPPSNARYQSMPFEPGRRIQ